MFASLGSPPALDEYLGETMLGWFDRVFDGRDLELLGYMRQRVPANWKLMFENIKDPYHASLLHVFLVTFGLFRADNPSVTEMDESGRHSVLVSERGAAASEATGEMRAFRDVKLQDPRLLDPVREFPGSRDRRDADPVAEPDRAAAVEHVGDAPARAARARASST